MEIKQNRFSKRIKISLYLLTLILTISFIYTSFINFRNLEELNNQILCNKKQIQNLNQVLNFNLDKIEDFEKGNKSKLHNPTFEEVYDFILNDKTNDPSNIYDDISNNCVHFSRTVNNNAEKTGIRCAYVEIELENNYPHAIVAFNTTDYDLVFFEPQTDDVVFLEIRKDYWRDCVLDGKTHGPGWIVLNYTLYW